MSCCGGRTREKLLRLAKEMKKEAPEEGQKLEGHIKEIDAVFKRLNKKIKPAKESS